MKVACVVCYRQTNDPVISTENDDELMLKADLSLFDNGVGLLLLFHNSLLFWSFTASSTHDVERTKNDLNPFVPTVAIYATLFVERQQT